jgi:FAD/FMN-containing dehydrogenase
MTSLETEFRAILGDSGVLTGDDVLARSCDPFREVPPGRALLLRPATTEALSRVMALCHSRGQRVVIHGGRTGVAGGAYSSADEIIVSLERMNRIEHICPETQLADVEAGVPVEALQTEAARHGLFYPVDLGSKGSATIGGTIATNAGGNRVLRWGMTRQNVLGLEAVLADGTVVSAMNHLVKNNTGYDLKHLLIGTEGTIGVVTRAVMRLVPAPTSHNTAFVAVSNHAQLLQLLTCARRLMTLSAFEVMWPDYYELVANSNTKRRPLEPGYAAYVLIEAMGYQPAIDQQLFDAFLQEAYAAGLIADAVVATSGQQNADLWRVREAAPVLVAALSPFVSFDISLDVREVEHFMAMARAALSRRYPVVATATFGHLGDNNIHIAAHVGPDTLAEEANVERIVFDELRAFGGAITAEHGIGQTKRAFLPDHRSKAEMAMMRDVRTALDPARLLNRDVLF